MSSTTATSFLATIMGPSCLDSGTFKIPSSYGYVILTGVGCTFLTAWQAIQVGKLRKMYKINYPTMYSADNNLFNCYQRAHQNTLENIPQILTMLAWGGLEMPILASTACAIWILGRVSYSKGYYTGDPRNRMKGSYGYLGSILLLGASLKFAYRLIRSG